MFVNVLILRQESNYDQVLTYYVPEDTKRPLHGFLVIVPVRFHEEKGIVIEILAKAPDIKGEIKPIKRFLGTEPLLNPEALLMARWISDYYVCSLNRAIHLFFPPPVRLKEKQVVSLNTEKTKLCLLFSDVEKMVIDYLKNSEEQKASLSEILKKNPQVKRNTIDSLAANGFVSLGTEFYPAMVHKKRKYVKLSEAAPTWGSVNARAHRQREILKALQEGPVALEELKKDCDSDSGSVYQVLKTLQQKGWISLYEETLFRDPHSELLEGTRPQVLNPYQEEATEAICEGIGQEKSNRWLLHGVTGSGKTEVYLKAIETALRRGKQVLYLVPEIALTPQVTTLLVETFGSKTAVLHSSLSAGERYDEWCRIKGGEAQVVLGPRSALFAPFTALGLIIIDEEHENTYKQNEPDPRYDTRSAAEKMAEIYQATLVYGSATPSLERYYSALQGDIKLLSLPHRVASRPMPIVTVVDMKPEMKEGNKSIFSRKLLAAMENVIKKNEQVILFLNRRGFHTFVLCPECGEALTCPHCAITLTYHQNTGQMVCHYCNYRAKPQQSCPYCGSHYLRYSGSGTERVANELQRVMPQVKYLRMDADTTRNKGSHTNILKEFQMGKAQVLIGTQMIAKGLDFPAVTLVGIINTDAILNMPDYRAAERAYQLTAQVSGRAGRGDKPGEVIVQTYNPDNHIFVPLIRQDYKQFYHKEIEVRQMMNYPPFVYLVRVLVSGFMEKKVSDRVDYLAKMLKIEIEENNLSIEVVGPGPAPLQYLKRRFRYHFILKGSSLKDVQMLAHLVRETAAKVGNEEGAPRIIIDVEPQTLL